MKLTILSIEYSLCPPDERLGDALFNPMFGRATPHVPVLHIFGRTAAQSPYQSVCCHVHNYFPFFCVPCHPGGSSSSSAPMNSLHFGAMLEAVAISKLRLPPGSRILHHVALVEGIPFYGYHSAPQPYFKVFVYQPSLVSKLANLLQTTSHVGGRSWQPHEAHIPFHFQFMVEYGLVGTGVMEITDGGILRPYPATSDGGGGVGGPDEHLVTVPPFPEDVLDGCTCAPEDWDLPRLSTAEIEVDVTPECLPPCTTPGSSLNGVKRSLREYVRDHNHPPTVLWDAVKPVEGRYGTVASAQRQDPMIPHMMRLAKKYFHHRKANGPADVKSCEGQTDSGSNDANRSSQLANTTTPLHELMRRYVAESSSSDPTLPELTNDDDNDDNDEDGFMRLSRPCGTLHLLDFIADEGDPVAELHISDADDDKDDARDVDYDAPSCSSSSSDVSARAEEECCDDIDLFGDDAADPTMLLVQQQEQQADVDRTMMDDDDDDDDDERPLFDDYHQEVATMHAEDDAPLFLLSPMAVASTATQTAPTYRLTADTSNTFVLGGDGSPDVRTSMIVNVETRLVGWDVKMLRTFVRRGSLHSNASVKDFATDEEGAAFLFFHVKEERDNKQVSIQWYTTVEDTPWNTQAPQFLRHHRLVQDELFLTNHMDVMDVQWVLQFGVRVDVVTTPNRTALPTSMVGEREQYLCRYSFVSSDGTFHDISRPDGGVVAVPGYLFPDGTSRSAMKRLSQALTKRGSSLASFSSPSLLSFSARSLSGRLLDDATEMARQRSQRPPHVLSVEEISAFLPTTSQRSHSSSLLLSTPVHSASGATLSTNPNVQRREEVHAPRHLTFSSIDNTEDLMHRRESKRPREEHDDGRFQEANENDAVSVVSEEIAESHATSRSAHSSIVFDTSLVVSIPPNSVSMPTATASTNLKPTTSPAVQVADQEGISASFVEPLDGRWEARGAHLTRQEMLCLELFPVNPLLRGDNDALSNSHTGANVRSLSRATAPMLTTVTANPRSGDRRAEGMRRPQRKPPPVRMTSKKNPRMPSNGGTSVFGTSTTGGTAGQGGPPKISMLTLCCIDVIADAEPDRFSDSSLHPILAVGIATTSTHTDHIDVRYWMVGTSPHLPKAFNTSSNASSTAPLPLPSTSPSPSSTEVIHCASESVLLQRVVAHLQELDSDVLISWDSMRRGIGYVSDRCRIVLRLDAFAALSRLARQRASAGQHGGTNSIVSGLLHKAMGIKVEEGNAVSSDEDNDEEARKGNFAARSTAISAPTVGAQRQQSARIAGRVVLNLSKVIRSELKQTSYTMQAVHHSLFGVPLPQYTDGYIADVYKKGVSTGSAVGADGTGGLLRFALHILCDLIVVPLAIIRHLDLIVRTCELAQLYGILFLEVLSRGSQYRVESFMLRFAKPRGFVAVSPSREQVALQNRQEGIALVMEPYSGFYTDPVVVLDFRSLYPSMMMAYNLCFSTCLGKISKEPIVKVGTVPDYRTPFQDILQWLPGDVSEATQHAAAEAMMRGGGVDAQSASKVIFSPTSCMFVGDTDARRGILPEMLEQIIATRMQVQAVMKLAAADGDEVTRRVLDAQQLGLKLLANVTYGYTAATFSGRMPCSDIADSIVLLGRQTLERAIRHIEGSEVWRAKVIYGDTDSLFIHLPGRTKEEAFKIAKEMASVITASNPDPVVLKFEKVYQPCLMITKKRYVGYSWEAPQQQVPVFDAKGIETIRRDQCAATARVLESLIRCLFDHSGDLTRLKTYFTEQVTKILRHDINPTDVIIRREVKLGTYAKDSTLPPAARVALKKIQRDSASAPLYGERVPYVVLTGGSHNAGSDKLMDLVEDPLCVLRRDVPFAIHGDHYMRKHILPALERVFHLVGVDFGAWYQTMPRLLSSKSHLFSVDLCKWIPPGLAEVRAEEWSASRTAVFDCARDLVRFQQRHRKAGGGVQSCMTSFAQSVRCAVCGVGKSHTAPSMPPVCAACLGPDALTLADSVSRVMFRRKAVEGELQRVALRCQQCTWSRPAGIEDLEEIAAQVPRKKDRLDIPLAIDRCSASAPILGACVSLECSQTFLLVRVRELLQQLHVLEDFLLRGVASSSGTAAGKVALPAPAAAKPPPPSSLAAAFGRFAAAPRIGGKDRPMEIE